MNVLSTSIVYNLYLRSVSLSRSDDCYRVYDNPYSATRPVNAASSSSFMSKHIGSPVYRPATLNKVNDNIQLVDNADNEGILIEQTGNPSYMRERIVGKNLTEDIKLSSSSSQQSINTLKLSCSTQVNSLDELDLKTQSDISQINTQVNISHCFEMVCVVKNSIIYYTEPYMANCVGNMSDSMGFLHFNEQMNNCRTIGAETNEEIQLNSINTSCTLINASFDSWSMKHGKVDRNQYC